MKLRTLIAAAVMTAGLGLAASAQAFPGLPVVGGQNLMIENAAFGCGSGFTRGPYGHCRPRFTCPMGWHPGPHGNHCFPTHPWRRWRHW